MIDQTYQAEIVTPKMKRQHWVYEQKQTIWMFLRGIFWKTLWLIHLARPYARLSCRLNIYAKYSLSGCCMWCGEKHGIHWKITQPNNGGLLKEMEKI